MATKTQIKTQRARIQALRAELASDYTRRLGAAAVRCVRETLEQAESRLAEMTAPR